jgi:hypothetical protein
MAQIERKIEITFRWWNDDQTEVKPSHIEALEETAKERIFQQMNEGMTSGELTDNIHIDNTDGEDGIAYSGWWEINTITL